MTRTSDQHYLVSDQYADGSKLSARIALHERFSTNRYGFARWVFDHLPTREACRVLELGCGTGLLWRRNADRVAVSWEITLSDLFAGMLSETQQALAALGRSFQYAEVDAQTIPYADGTFDCVLANHMLYHVPDVGKALAEIRRVLKPGGRLFATTNGRAHLQEIRDLVVRFEPSIYWPNEEPEHFGLETGLDMLRSFFPKVGLERYEDSLAITEVEPLVAFVLSAISSNGPEVLVGTKVGEFGRFIRDQLAGESVIRVTKDTGLFIAYKGL